MDKILRLHNIAGVWSQPENYQALSWYSFEGAVKCLELIAEDHSYTFKTSEQRHKRNLENQLFDQNAHLPYGP